MDIYRFEEDKGFESKEHPINVFVGLVIVICMCLIASYF